jgi:hypothetical protein
VQSHRAFEDGVEPSSRTSRAVSLALNPARLAHSTASAGLRVVSGELVKVAAITFDAPQFLQRCPDMRRHSTAEVGRERLTKRAIRPSKR